MVGGEFSPEVAQRIITRDQGSCASCGRRVTHLLRGVWWSIHHRRPRGEGGTSLEWVGLAANGVVLCGSGTTGCHGRKEKDREQATRDGFLISMNGTKTAVEVPLTHVLFGRVRLDNAGGYELAGGEDWT